MRKIVFWIHLVAGLSAGLVIAIMSFTGAALAFEKEIIAWAERDARRVVPAASGLRLSLTELLAKLREKRPDERPSTITIYSDPNLAVLVGAGRTNAIYANQYTGEIREHSSRRVRSFMQVMIEWHRWLGIQVEKRPLAKGITGAANVVFLFLALSGLYLWFPRKWSISTFKSIALMSFTLRGRARDWNWHNTIGVWSAGVLVVLTATALPISYRWAGNLIYKLTGTEAPPQGGSPQVSVTKPAPDANRLDYDTLLAALQKEIPAWEQVTIRLGSGGPRGGRGPEGSRSAEARPERRSTEDGTSAITMTVKERRGWPLFANTQITLDPFTGAILQKESFQNYNLGRKVRSWTRFLHTGEALGLPGKALAGLASAGGVLLAWTGFALAFRRFFKRKANETIPANQP